MIDNIKAYKDILDLASSQIDSFLNEKEKNEETFLYLEKWLATHLNKLRVKKLENIQNTSNQDIDPNQRKDGILIVNTATEIIQNPGFQNYFTEYINHSEKQYLKDLIDKESRNEFETVFLEAISEKKNTKTDIFLRTGINKKSKCLLEFDITSSNLANNRIVIYYSFYDLLDVQLLDFQSIVLDNIPGIDVFLFDRDYRYILAGGKEKQKYNLSNSDFIGRRFFDMFDKQIQRRLFTFYNKAINGEFTEGEVRIEKDILYIAAAPVKNNSGETIAGILISQNVTKDKLLEENLIKSKEEAQRADKAKSIFLANMSHEIRTPLNSIIGFSEQLNKTSLTEKQQKLISLIDNSSEHLLYLVNEVVFLFKLGMNKVYIEKINFSIKELLQEINDILSKRVSEKGLNFIFEMDDRLPEVLVGDQYRLRQILMNLLVNANKYTDAGEVSFRVKVEKETKRKVHILFEISDTGIGISQKDLPYIFDVFEQGNNRTEKIRGGAGLGLGICKKLVELFNGEINVTSKVNKGSTFYVQIPFEKPTTVDIQSEEKEYNLNDNLLVSKKILLADDDDHNLLLAKMILNEWNANYTLVEDGRKAIEKIDSEKFDLILLDIHMPAKSGVEVVKYIRKKSKLNKSTPVIALTANALKSDINNYLKIGFNDYVIKPFKEVGLYNKICNVLKIENHTTHKKSIIVNETTEPLPTDSFDVKELHKTANGDDQFFNMMINNFIQNAENLVVIFNENMEKQNWTEIGEKAHKAIPSFKFFKLLNTAKKLSHLENQILKENLHENLDEIMKQTIQQINDIVEKAKAAKI